MASSILSSACRTNTRVQCTMYTHTCTYTSTRTVKPNDSREKYNGAKQQHQSTWNKTEPSFSVRTQTQISKFLAPTPDLGKGYDLSGRTIIRGRRDCSKISQKKRGVHVFGTVLTFGFLRYQVQDCPQHGTGHSSQSYSPNSVPISVVCLSTRLAKHLPTFSTVPFHPHPPPRSLQL